MIDMKSAVRKAAFDALYFSGANDLLRPFAQGAGAILMLHHVAPARSDEFQPNSFLEITPDFLERMIRRLAHNGYRFVSMDEVHARLAGQRFDERFIAITFDDGFRDNKVWAQPILAKYKVPYAIYIPTDFVEGGGNLWWFVFEWVVARNERIEVDGHTIACATTREKFNAYDELKQMVLAQPSHSDEIAFVRRLAERYGYDQATATREACMNWDEIRALCADPLATIGAHTVSHPLLAKLPDGEARAELAESRNILESKLQRDVRHLAYPFGSADAAGPREFRLAAELGYKTAVTTRAGVVAPADASRLMQLPRITIDGAFQRERHLDVLVSGVAPAAWNGLRRALRPGSPRPAWA